MHAGRSRSKSVPASISCVRVTKSCARTAIAGWLHALFRYEDQETGHAAETSFGAHMFNALVTYKGEPQSYKGPPPGLSTRLFLRVGPPPLDTLCHLIYPASRPWHATSDTALILMSSQ